MDDQHIPGPPTDLDQAKQRIIALLSRYPKEWRWNHPEAMLLNDVEFVMRELQRLQGQNHDER